jgi:peptidoglycan L-alanyl-D-glutamate endopeptidase CwlK
MRLSATSIARLKGVHPDLVRVIKRAAAATQVPFLVVEGVRTLERQKQLLKAGATTTLNSRHITGHAVDLVPMIDGKARWDWPLYHRLAPFIWAAAKAEKVTLEWGGDWKKFPDAPHWQLPRKQYP